MGMLEDLTKMGADVESAVKRIRGDAELYQELVIDSIEYIKEYEVLSFLDNGDIEQACSNAHALKGVMGNLGITPLFKLYSDINMLLKADKVDEARERMSEAEHIQEEFIKCIEKYM